MYKVISVLIIVGALCGLISGCIEPNAGYSKIAPGRWRAVLDLERIIIPAKDKKEVSMLYADFNEGQLPFNFDVVYDSPDVFHLEICNGKERIRVDSIGFGRNARTARDTIRIWFPEYQSYIRADVREKLIEGEWVVTTKKDYSIPFKAKMGVDYRFTNMNEKPVLDLSGKWAAAFGPDSTLERAVGEFVQNGNHLEGTFRTETGDYRFLEGTIQGNKFWMSCFDGAHAFLFSGKIQGDSLLGEFRSGKHSQVLWSAHRDPNFELGNPETLTQLKNPGSGISFALENTEGKMVQFPAQEFDHKVKIFTISGTWCPNCRDEQVFLTEFLKKNPEMAQQMRVVSCSFERNEDAEQAKKHLKLYKSKLGLPYDLVYAGMANTKEAEKIFPSLSKVMAFPTMMILDKKNKVRMIHTGFDGPATSKYAAFQASFAEQMKMLINETE